MSRMPAPSARPSTSVATALAARNAAAASKKTASSPLNDPSISRQSPQFTPESSARRTSGTMVKPSSDPAAAGGENIRVCVRIRPPNEREERHSVVPAWSWQENTIAQTNSVQRNRAAGGVYTFDHLFDPLRDTEEIYDNAVRRVILATMGGYHGSVFAYGQTSTGKTHTMQGTEDQPGVIPLAIEECFSYVSASQDDREFLFRVSYLEIYNEQINDLLCPASTQANVRIMESKKLGVQLQGVKEEVVISPQQVFALISAGEAQRHVGSTDANKNSSRSHTIFRMVIESRSRSGRGRSVMSTLSLVDLAGSESVRLANTHGQRQIEGGFINKSLLTLGKVVSMLTEDGDKVGYIPYRDSKLTRLLQPSLGGNAQITIICTVTAALLSVDETNNTLKFANRAKRIKNHANINEVSNEKTLLKKYLEEIAELKEQLARAKASAEEAASVPPPMPRLSPTARDAMGMGSPSARGGFHAIGGNGSSEHGSNGGDVWVEEDDTEVTLQNTIARLERLILKSRVSKAETPSASRATGGGGGGGAAGADTKREGSSSSGGGNGGGGGGDGSVDGLSIGTDGRNGGARSRLRAPLTDRPSMPSRRQSTSFFDTKPLHSARDSGGSFTKAWNAVGSEKTGLGPVEEDDGELLKVRRPATARAAHSRRQSERWGGGWGGAADEVGVGTPPTVEGSAESSSGSPSDRRPPPLELPRGGLSRKVKSATALLAETDDNVAQSSGSRGRGSEGGGATSGADLDFELDEMELVEVHTELRKFLNKKRAEKLIGAEGGRGGGVAHEDVEELRQKLQRVEIDTALSQADSNFLQRTLEDKEAELQEKERDIAECMDLLEEMERREQELCEENAALRRENENHASEVTRLTAILAAREQELYELKGVDPLEETF